MSHKAVSIAINLLCLAVAVALLVGNNNVTALNIASVSFQAHTGTVLIALYLIGATIGILSVLPFIAGTRKTDVAKLKDWQKQDAKLLKEVQSDKEKQLEAKIATLEVALKQALKK